MVPFKAVLRATFVPPKRDSLQIPEDSSFWVAKQSLSESSASLGSLAPLCRRFLEARGAASGSKNRPYLRMSDRSFWSDEERYQLGFVRDSCPFLRPVLGFPIMV